MKTRFLTLLGIGFYLSSLALATPFGPGQGEGLRLFGPATAGSGGISSVNGLTDSVQTFATGTSGTDFAISSSSGVHTFNLPTASSSNRGLLSATDWTTFNGKQGALTIGNLTSSTTGLSVTGGTGAVIGSGAALSIQTASGSQPGLLSSTDWATFNGKQDAGNYITALTGEVTASGPGSSAATLTNSAVIGKVLTGFSAGAGSVAATDTILQGFNKLVGNMALKAPLASPSFTGTIGTQLTGSRGVVTDSSGNLSVASGNLSGTNTGDVTIGTANGLSLASQALSLQAATDSVPGAMTAADHTKLTGLLVENMDGQVDSASNTTYYIRPYVHYAGTVSSIYLKCGSGSITANVKINSTSVTSLSAVSVTSTGAVTSSTGSNTAAVADVITIVTTSNSSCAPLIWSVKYTRS